MNAQRRLLRQRLFRRGRHGRQQGFTLIEVIIAFALLAFALTLLLGSLTNATKQVRNANDFGRAALHAQTLLDQAGVGEALTVGQRDGELEDGRYRWDMAVSPFVEPTAPPQQAQVLGAPQLLQIDLNVRWGDGGRRQTLHLKSLRLVTPTDLNAAGVVP